MSKEDGDLHDAVKQLGFPRLPNGWCWTRVGDVGEVRLGRQRSPKNRSDKHPTKYMRAANITWRGIDLSDVLDMEFTPTEQEVYRLVPGDLILSEASGSPDEVGKPAIWRDELENCCFQNTVIRFRSAVTAPKYAHIIFDHFARNGVFALTSKGVNINHLSAARFAKIPFPLAPRNEQERIAGRVEELFSDLDAGVAALKRVKANLKRYRASVLKAAVEGELTEEWRRENPAKETASELLDRILKERRKRWEEQQLATYEAKGKKPPKGWQGEYQEPAEPDVKGLPELPKSWLWTTVDALTAFGPQNGLYLPKSAYGTGSPIFRIDDFQNDWSRSAAELLLVGAADKDARRYGLRKGDLVVNRVNSMTHLGKCFAVEPRHLPAVFESNMMRLGLVSNLNLKYVQFYLQSDTGRMRLTENAKWAVNQASINQQDVAKTPLPLPPLAEQEVIAAEVEQQLTLAKEVQSGLAVDVKRSSRLRQSILKRAFEGKLVSQDPSDEPAAKLLDRIAEIRHKDPDNGKGRRSRSGARQKTRRSK